MSGTKSFRSKFALLANDRIAALGDSRIGQGFVGADGKAIAPGAPGSATSINVLFWASFFGRGRFRAQAGDSFGVSGETTAQILARTDEALAASDAAAVLVFCSLNDVVRSTPEQTQANLTQIIDKIIRADRLPVIVSETPVGPGKRFTGKPLAYHLENAEFLRRHARAVGALLIDPWPVLLDPASKTAHFRAGHSVDGFHLSINGAIRIGQLISDALTPFYPPVALVPVAQASVYCATHQLGSLNANPLLADAAPVAEPQGAGDLAPGYALITNGEGLRVRLSKKVDAAGRERQQVEISGHVSNPHEFVEISQTVRTSGFVVGQPYLAAADIRLHAGHRHVGWPSLVVAPDASERIFSPRGFSSDATLDPDLDLSGVLVSQIYLRAAQDQRLQLSLRLYFKPAPDVAALLDIYALSVTRC